MGGGSEGEGGIGGQRGTQDGAVRVIILLWLTSETLRLTSGILRGSCGGTLLMRKFCFGRGCGGMGSRATTFDDSTRSGLTCLTLLA